MNQQGYIMDEGQFKLINSKLDKVETALCGDEYDPVGKPGLIRIVMKHDVALFGDKDNPGIIQEIMDTKDRKAKFDGMKLLVGALAGGALCIAALVEVIDKAAAWASAVLKK